MCKAFDVTGNGYVRSEAVVTVFLQKDSVAKRNYATIMGALINTDEFKYQGITFPSDAMQNKLIQEVYAKCGVIQLRCHMWNLMEQEPKLVIHKNLILLANFLPKVVLQHLC